MSDRPTGSESKGERSIGVRELRASLAAHLTRVEGGDTLIVNRGGRPVARLAPLDEVAGLEFGLEDLARLGLVERPRPPADGGSSADPGPGPAARPLPVDIRVDRVVRQVRG